MTTQEWNTLTALTFRNASRGFLIALRKTFSAQCLHQKNIIFRDQEIIVPQNMAIIKFVNVLEKLSMDWGEIMPN
jgi:hypothetical protein